MSNISSILVHKEYICNKSLIKVILVTSFVIMTCLGAYVRIPLPFTPVPITLQTFFVIQIARFVIFLALCLQVCAAILLAYYWYNKADSKDNCCNSGIFFYE